MVQNYLLMTTALQADWVSIDPSTTLRKDQWSPLGISSTIL